MQTTLRGRMFQLYSWVTRPTTVHSLRSILRLMSDEDLLVLMRDAGNKQVLTIAWAEYGRRHANVKLEFEMQSADVLSVRAADLVIASGAQLVC